MANAPTTTAIAITGEVSCWTSATTNNAEKMGAFIVVTNALPSVPAAATFQTRFDIGKRLSVGYHTLTVGQVILEDAPDRLKKGLAKHPIPIMLLARLTVDRRWQGRGVGKALLRDAIQRTLQAANIAGIRALAVHAKDEEARRFHEHFDFAPSPADPMHLFVLLKDVRRVLAT